MHTRAAANVRDAGTEIDDIWRPVQAFDRKIKPSDGDSRQAVPGHKFEYSSTTAISLQSIRSISHSRLLNVWLPRSCRGRPCIIVFSETVWAGKMASRKTFLGKDTLLHLDL